MLEARKLGRKVGKVYFYLWGMGSEKKGRPKQVSSYRAKDASAALALRSSKKGMHLPSAAFSLLVALGGPALGLSGSACWD